MVPVTQFASGLSLALLSCALSALGLTLQRLSALREEERCNHDLEASAPSRRYDPMWLLGVAIYIVASVPDVISYTLVPQVVCSAVACFRLVVVTVLACTVLGEKLSARQSLGMAACTIGTFLCLCFGPIRMEKAAMLSGFQHPEVKIYLAAGAGVLLMLFALDHANVFSSKCSKLSARCRTITLPLLTGLAFAMSKVFNTMIGFLQQPHMNMNDILLHPEWIAMASAVAILGITDFYLNLRATRLMAVQVFVPVSFVWCISLQYFQSVVLFAEFDGLDTLHAGLSIAGACISLLGAICIQLPKIDRTTELRKKSNGIPSSPSQSGVDMEECRDKARIFLET